MEYVLLFLKELLAVFSEIFYQRAKRSGLRHDVPFFVKILAAEVHLTIQTTDKNHKGTFAA